MYTLTPQKVAEITGGKYIGGSKLRNTPVTGAVRDNRDVNPGNMFVCIQGSNTDGHLYANDAFDAGAACCLAEKEIPDAKGAYILVDSTLESVKVLGAYHRSQFNLPVIGITGSVGKTTAKELIAATLGAKLNVLKTEKNMNNELGVPLTLLSIRPDHTAAVIEMGISGHGEMSRLAAMVKPDIFVMTNIGYSHTNELGDLSGVLRAKTEAFAYMSSNGTALLNGDDTLLQAYEPGLRKITFGVGQHNDYRAVNIKPNSTKSIEMDVQSSQGSIHIQVPAYGSHIASLAPAAIAIGYLLGLKDAEMQCGLSLCIRLEGRSYVSNVNGVTLIDDSYNANPSSVKSALISLSQLPGRHVAILGDMLNLGPLSAQLHYDIGKFAALCGVEVLICHGADARHIADGYNASGGKGARFYPKMELLIRAILGKIKKGDAVLVKASHDLHFEKLLPVISGVISDF